MRNKTQDMSCFLHGPDLEILKHTQEPHHAQHYQYADIRPP
jgi:hypothetical protein